MAVKVAINGFGRIGRLVLRAAIESGRSDVEVTHVNDLGSVEANAHMFRYDSVHGRFPGEVRVEGDALHISANGRQYAPIRVTAERDPTKLPWAGVDVGAECTGIFSKSSDAAKLMQSGVRKVLVSAPVTWAEDLADESAQATIVYGVNHKSLKPSHKIVSNASCTTNCLAPVAQVLHETFGILRGYMLTIHSYTGDQPTVDTLHKDLHRARAAAVSAIPTSTGAAKAMGLVLPELKGKLDGSAIRIPTPNVSLVSLDVNLRAEGVTREAVNAAMREASEGYLKGILGYSTAPLVSMDFNHDPHSSTFDATQTQVVDGAMVRVMTWYDNEWGFSNRMSDTAALLGSL